MDVNIRINGVLLEGVSAGSVKLNINNPDPFTFSDPTVSYTASIEVPRSEVNDRVFRADRFPWLFNRTAPYTAELDFGGLIAPQGSGLFRAQVAVGDDSYTVTLVESLTKLSSIQAPVIARPDNAASPAYWINSYDGALGYAYNANLNRPPTFNFGSVFVYPAYFVDTKTVLASDMVGTRSQTVYRTAHDYLLGARYPTTHMLALDNTAACYLEYMTGTTITLTFTTDSFIWLPAQSPVTVYLGSNRSTGLIPLTRSGLVVNGNYKYSVGAGATLVVQPVGTDSTLFRIHNTNSTSGTQLTPATNIPTGEGYYFGFEITSVGQPSYQRAIAPDTGVSKAFDLVQAYCKAFCWTYSFRSSPFNITLKPFVNSSTISIYRQDWTGKINMPTVKISETAGIARTFTATAGDAVATVTGSPRALQSVAAGAESSLPVSFGARPYATMIHYTAGVAYPNTFFTSATGYRKQVGDHYARFSKGWQVTAKMNLSYFDVFNMLPDALYYIDELGSWFYLRSIQSWNAGDSTANVTLIAANY